MTPAAPTDRVVIAVVTRPHGIRGGLRVRVFNPDTEVLVPGARMTLTPKDGPARTVRVLSVRPEKDTWIVTLEGVTSRTQAEALRGAELSVSRAELPPLEEGEYYHVDLPGCEVRDVHGARFGVVRDVIRYPSVDALVVETDEGVVEIPVVEGIVTSIDVPGRSIVVDREALREE